MAALTTPQVNIGWKAEEFHLKGVDGKNYSLKHVRGENGLVVMFICNHCPFVRAIADKLAVDMKLLQKDGVGVVAISSNDAAEYPEDSYDNMKTFAQSHGFTFPYLYDETQEAARAYGAVCTPDFFGFDANLHLQYRGRFDSSGMQANVKGDHELLNAMRLVAKTGKAPEQQSSSIGCSIKWRQVS
jgi:peroxiredoxin